MKISEIIGKQVFVIYDAKFLGTVHDVAFDDQYKKVLGFYFFDQDENEYYLKTQNIFGLEDYVTIKNSTKIANDFLLDKHLSPLGKQVVGISGQDYDLLSDIEIDKNYMVKNFITSKYSFNADEIMHISNCILVGQNFKMQNFRPHKTKQKTEQLTNLTVSIMKMEEPKSQIMLMPPKITVNSDILLGKHLSKDIFGKNSELILKQNQTITPKQVMIAKQHDKLNELFYSVY